MAHLRKGPFDIIIEDLHGTGLGFVAGILRDCDQHWRVRLAYNEAFFLLPFELVPSQQSFVSVSETERGYVLFPSKTPSKRAKEKFEVDGYTYNSLICTHKIPVDFSSTGTEGLYKCTVLCLLVALGAVTVASSESVSGSIKARYLRISNGNSFHIHLPNKLMS